MYAVGSACTLQALVFDSLFPPQAFFHGRYSRHKQPNTALCLSERFHNLACVQTTAEMISKCINIIIPRL